MDSLANFLAQRSDSMEPGDGLALAHGLARLGRSDGLRVLGLMGGLSDVVDSLGMDLLSWAARGGDEACLLLAGELCLAGGADQWGGGALHHWCEVKTNGGGAGAQILLALGVSPTRRDQWGLMPMHWSKDPTVWAWSMAALWSRGDPNGWMDCNGVGFVEVANRMKNHPFLAWVEKSKSHRRPSAFRTSIEPAKADVKAGIPVEYWERALSDRIDCIAAAEARQDALLCGIPLESGGKESLLAGMSKESVSQFQQTQ